MLPKEFDDLIELLKKYPSITKSHAIKIASFLINKDINEINQDVNIFLNILENIKKCSICNYYANQKQCNICLSDKREKKLMIVENVSQIQKYEDWKIFNGKYFCVPILFNKKFERINLNFDFDFLIKYIDNFNEIIIGISPTAEGFLTSNFIFDTIKKIKPNTNISKLAIGIPMGSNVDYMDQATLSYAIENRKDIK